MANKIDIELRKILSSLKQISREFMVGHALKRSEDEYNLEGLKYSEKKLISEEKKIKKSYSKIIKIDDKLMLKFRNLLNSLEKIKHEFYKYLDEKKRDENCCEIFSNKYLELSTVFARDFNLN